MSKFFKYFTFCTIILVSSNKTLSFHFQEPSLEVKEIFNDFYYDGYRERFCYQNIVSFIRLLHHKKVDLKKSRLIKITNDGVSSFGMVQAEFARPVYLEKKPKEKNWYFHVILERDGFIYDFDFSNQPEILRTEEYFEQMFLNESDKGLETRMFVKKDKKLNQYLLKITPALEFIKSNNSEIEETTSQEMLLKDFLKKLY